LEHDIEVPGERENMTTEHQNEEMGFSEQGYEVHQQTCNEIFEHANDDSYGKLINPFLLSLPNLTCNIDLSRAQLLFIDSPESLSSFINMGDWRTPALAFSAREALLMRNFIESMALWVSRFLDTLFVY
jgi:hypothetical protein